LPETTSPTTTTAAAGPKKAKEKSQYGIERRTRRSRTVRESLKTKIRAAEKTAGRSQTEAAQKKIKAAVSALDKAAEKGVIHKNAAARRKSHLLRKLAKAAKAATAEVKKKKA